MAKTEGVNLWIEFTPFNSEHELSISKKTGIDTLGIIAVTLDLIFPRSLGLRNPFRIQKVNCLIP